MLAADLELLWLRRGWIRWLLALLLSIAVAYGVQAARGARIDFVEQFPEAAEILGTFGPFVGVIVGVSGVSVDRSNGLLAQLVVRSRRRWWPHAVRLASISLGLSVLVCVVWVLVGSAMLIFGESGLASELGWWGDRLVGLLHAGAAIVGSGIIAASVASLVRSGVIVVGTLFLAITIGGGGGSFEGPAWAPYRVMNLLLAYGHRSPELVGLDISVNEAGALALGWVAVAVIVSLGRARHADVD